MTSNPCFISKTARGASRNCGKWQAWRSRRGASAGGGGRRSGLCKAGGRRRRRPEPRGARRWRPGPTLGSGAALRRARAGGGSRRGRGVGAERGAPHLQLTWARAARLGRKKRKLIVGILNLRPGQRFGGGWGSVSPGRSCERRGSLRETPVWLRRAWWRPRSPSPRSPGARPRRGTGVQTRVDAGEGRSCGGKDTKFKAAHRSPPGAARTAQRLPPPRPGCTARARARPAASAAGALRFAM